MKRFVLSSLTFAATALIFAVSAGAPHKSAHSTAAAPANKTAPQRPAHPRTEEEKALEKKFDTEVKRDVLTPGDGQQQTRDRMGEGDVGLFYDHNQDDRIGDDDDSIGLEWRLFRFE